MQIIVSKNMFQNTENFIGCLAASKDDPGVNSLLQLLDRISGAYKNGPNMINMTIPIEFDHGITEERDFNVCIGKVDPENVGDKNASFTTGNFNSVSLNIALASKSLEKITNG